MPLQTVVRSLLQKKRFEDFCIESFTLVQYVSTGPQMPGKMHHHTVTFFEKVHLSL